MKVSKERIEEIKKDYALKWSYGNWNSFLVHCKMNDWNLLDFHLNQVIDLIQEESLRFFTNQPPHLK